MVRVILERLDAARANTDHHVAAIICHVRSPSRISPRTDPFSAVRRRPVEADQTSPAVPSRLCRVADDTQIYSFCQSSDVNGLAGRVSACFDEVSSWMQANRLQVNPSKTEVLWCASGRRKHQIPTSPVHIGLSAVLMCCRYPLFPTLGYILTPTSVCEHTSLPPSDRALQHYIRFEVFNVFHNTPCCH